MKEFRDADEFRRAFERILEFMDEHAEVGCALRGAKAPHRFLFTDLGLELLLA